jgi:hypothetical protein
MDYSIDITKKNNLFIFTFITPLIEYFICNILIYICISFIYSFYTICNFYILNNYKKYILNFQNKSENESDKSYEHDENESDNSYEHDENDEYYKNDLGLHLNDIPFIDGIIININYEVSYDQTISNAEHLKIELIQFIVQNNINIDYGYYLLKKFTNAIDNFLLDANMENYSSLEILISPIIQYIS